MTRLKDAPFDAKAADLVPGAGPCSACPKLTGNQPELFGDIKNTDVCTDPVCYAGKRAAWGERLQAQAKAEGRTVLTGKEAKRIAPHGVNSNLQEATCRSTNSATRTRKAAPTDSCSGRNSNPRR
jgi:hypothetical protein